MAKKNQVKKSVKKTNKKMSLAKGMFRITLNYNCKGVEKLNTKTAKGALRAQLYTTNPKSQGQGWVGSVKENTTDGTYFATVFPREADALPVIESVQETHEYILNGNSITPNDPMFETFNSQGFIKTVSSYSFVKESDDTTSIFLDTLIGNSELIDKPGIIFNFRDEATAQEITDRYEDHDDTDSKPCSISIIFSINRVKDVNTNFGRAERSLTTIVHNVEFGEHVSSKGIDPNSIYELLSLARQQAGTEEVSTNEVDQLLSSTEQAELKAYIAFPPVKTGKKKWHECRELHLRMLSEHPDNDDVMHAAFGALTELVDSSKVKYTKEQLLQHLEEVSSDLVEDYRTYINNLIEDASLEGESTAYNTTVSNNDITDEDLEDFDWS